MAFVNASCANDDDLHDSLFTSQATTRQSGGINAFDLPRCGDTLKSIAKKGPAQMAQEKQALLESLLREDTSERYRQQIIGTGVLVSCEKLDFFAQAGFEGTHLLPVLKALVEMKHVSLTREHMFCIKALVKGVTKPPLVNVIALRSIGQPYEKVRLVAQASFDPQHRVWALEGAHVLTGGNVDALKSFLQGGFCGPSLRGYDFTLAALMDEGTLPLVGDILKDVKWFSEDKILEACVGKSPDVLRKAAQLSGGERLPYLRKYLPEDDWLFATLGKDEHVDTNVILPALVLRLGSNEETVRMRFENALASQSSAERASRFLLGHDMSNRCANYQTLGLGAEHPFVELAKRLKLSSYLSPAIPRLTQ
ncbi:MAG: hypothetical protein C0514_08290 [Candidatus Puniceispirillum sp.]|nr:hypothetical protein [Candidatus Puniceispirillum sp.]